MTVSVSVRGKKGEEGKPVCNNLNEVLQIV